MEHKNVKRKTILPASRPSSTYTSIWRYESLGSRRPHAPLPSLAQHQHATSPPETSNSKQDHSGKMENVEDRNEIESIKEAEFFPGKSPDASCKSSMNVREKSCDPERHDSARERVIAALQLYRSICDELFRDQSIAGKESTSIRRIDCHAAKEVRKKLGYVHGDRGFIGDVPGVEVGDNFIYRMELSIVGLHRPTQGGIDYMGPRPNILATSVVASRDYADDLTNPDQLIYLGQGGKAEDQKLIQGNLALVNSMRGNKPVRVIRKDWDDTFTYDGLYVVDSYHNKNRANGKMIFKFLMKRLPGQPEIYQKKKMKVLESSE